MNNYADLDIELRNSSYHYQPHPIIGVSIMYRKASYLPSRFLHSLPLHSEGTNFSIMYFSSSNSSSWITLFGDEAMVLSSLRSVPLPTPTEIVSIPLALICCEYGVRSSSWSVFFPSVKKIKSFVTLKTKKRKRNINNDQFSITNSAGSRPWVRGWGGGAIQTLRKRWGRSPKNFFGPSGLSLV